MFFKIFIIFRFLFFSIECQDSSVLNSSNRLYFNLETSIINCFFSRTVLYSGSGGIIYIYNQNFNLQINECIFFQCGSTGSGGSIYYDCLNFFTNYSIKKTCGSECNCGSGGNGAFSISRSNGFNNIFSSSIRKCSSNGFGEYSILLTHGSQNINSLNNSLNFCNRYSSLGVINPTQFQLNFSTISNNIVNYYVCFELRGLTLNGLLRYCNILNNNSPSYGVCYITSNSIYLFQYFIFKDNSNILFYVENGCLLKIEHSSIHHSISIGNTISTLNVSFLNQNTLLIPHLFTFNCFANIPLKNSINITLSNFYFFQFISYFLFSSLIFFDIFF